ncbi:DUF4350 domain-containing protein [Cryobacterium psychrophilum]|uniref:DUF4350 domain-containing protein n=1 Tax=Cryobacterium psychrophilum TaxID=41988 RepID=A0A4Y8KLM1_9MICO|nr:DUF4350 domain-containing protein [Cryobacterium psychrophilum]TDW30738.1 hypothetical protein EDD25_2511 [Cryobacterium psychrophilum]TFD75856.1 DUF4350 domain-containing protein [Cryobacterium psychrophilum]
MSGSLVVEPRPLVLDDSAANATAVTPTVRESVRRSRFWIIAAAGTVLVTLVVVLLVGGPATGRWLAADSAAPSGAMALVAVLGEQGVTVVTVDTLAEARSATSEAAAPTLFVFDGDGFLDASRLTALGSLAPRTVIAAPDFAALQALSPEVGFGGLSMATDLTPQCSVPAAARAGSLSPGGGTLSIPEGTPESTPASGATLTGCFPSSDTTFSVIERAEADHTLTLVPDAAVFSNETIADFGNAAFALNLLGPSDTVVWYLPTLADVPRTGPPSIGDLTPGSVTPTLILLGLVAAAAALWRGRRFGPLVAENLPVTVKASETLEGRARLYARGNTRLRALDALRIGTVQRLAGRVGLGRSARLDDVVHSVAALTGLAAADVRGVLVQEHPTGDADLMRLANRLQEMERMTQAAVSAHSTTPHSAPHAPAPHDLPPHGRMDS